MATAKRWRMKCVVNLNVRTGPSTSAKSVGMLSPGTIIETSEEENGWYKHNKGGWSFGKKGEYLQFIIDLDTNSADLSQSVPKNKAEASKPPEAPSTEQPALGYEPNLETYDGLSTSLTSSMTFKQLRGLHGLPYQYMPSVDRRLNTDKGEMFYGRKFADKIMTKLPMLVLTPGRPAFMQGFSKKYKDNIAMNLYDTLGNKDKVSINDLLDNKGSGRYYTFEFAYADYYKSVNAMCRQMASFMGVGDTQMNGVKLKEYDWSKYVNSEMKGLVSGSEYVCFYVDSESQINENFSNSTGESMLASGLNQMSELGKEVGFLLGAGAGIEIDALNPENYESSMEAISNIVGKYNSGNIIERLKSGITTIAAGGELIFPEIWKDSSFSKSYDITIKLDSPDADDLSIYLNLMVPMIHLLGFALPVQMGYNGFSSPFLTRGFYKGFFSCEMGIVTDLSITKGGDSKWNVNGLPTSLEISMSIKDLYQVLAMSKTDKNNIDPSEFLKNTPMIDFLANMAGVNINKPELFRSLGMYKDALVGNIKNIPNNIWLDVNNYLSNQLDKSGFFK